MGAVGTGGRLASDMYIEHCKKESHLHQICSLNNIPGMRLVEIAVCASDGESPCAAYVHCTCASACVAGLGYSRLDGWLHRSIVQPRRTWFLFLAPTCGKPRRLRGAPAQSRCFQARAPAHHPCVLAAAPMRLQGGSRGPEPSGRKRPLSPACAVV